MNLAVVIEKPQGQRLGKAYSECELMRRDKTRRAQSTCAADQPTAYSNTLPGASLHTLVYVRLLKEMFCTRLHACFIPCRYQPPYLLDALEPQHEHGPLGDGLSGPELDRLGHPDRIRGPETQRQGVSLHAPLLYKHQGFQDYPVVATHTVRGGVHAMHADAGEDAGWHGRGKSGTS